MRVREKNGILNFLKMIFIDVDCPEEEVDIARSEDPKMKELKESLGRVDALARNFYISNSASNGGKSGGIVDKAEIDTAKAMEAAEKKEAARGQEGREI